MLLALQGALRSGEIWVKGSRRYANPASYLIAPELWERDRAELLKLTGKLGVRGLLVQRTGLSGGGRRHVARRVAAVAPPVVEQSGASGLTAARPTAVVGGPRHLGCCKFRFLMGVSRLPPPRQIGCSAMSEVAELPVLAERSGVLVADVAGHRKLEIARRYSLPSLGDRQRPADGLAVSR